MVQYPIQLQLTKVQPEECMRWLDPLAAVWNWAVRKIELLAHHGEQLDIPSRMRQGQLRSMLAYQSLARGTDYVEFDSKFSMTCSVCGPNWVRADGAGMR